MDEGQMLATVHSSVMKEYNDFLPGCSAILRQVGFFISTALLFAVVIHL